MWFIQKWQAPREEPEETKWPCPDSLIAAVFIAATFGHQHEYCMFPYPPSQAMMLTPTIQVRSFWCVQSASQGPPF